jgi:hypothetical protein
MAPARTARTRSALAVGALLLLGACGDGARLAPLDGGAPVSGVTPTAGWRPMAASPLSARYAAVAVAVRSEVLFIGGHDGPMCPPNADCAFLPPSLRDGAAYDAAADAWRPIAPAPAGIALGAETAVVNDVVYVLTAAAPQGTASAFLAYDVAADRWSSLPAPTRAGYLRLAAAGDSLVAYQSSHENGAPTVDQLYDVGSRRWSTLPSDPLVPSFDRSLLWAGDRLVLLAPKLVAQPGGADGPSWLRAATLDLTTRSWRALPETRQVISGELTPVWTGTHVVNPTPGGADGGATNGYGRTLPFGGRLDLSTGRWSTLSEAPDRYRGWGVSATSPTYAAVGSIVLDVAADQWLRLPTPEGPRVEGHSAAWVRDQLVVWGGGTFDDGSSRLVATGQVWSPGG